MLQLRTLHLASLCATLAAARPRGALGRSLAVADHDCSTLPGVWTGFVGTAPLYDEYSLQFEAGAPPGAFTAVVVRGAPGGEGWTLGSGQLSADNRSAFIVFDTGTSLHGNVSDDCSVISWEENGSSWQEASGIEVVHLLSMSHIDVGYHVGYGAFARINEVLQTYVDVFFPRAVAMARALRDLGGSERLLYTSHAWLLSLYLHCPANLTLSGETLRCPSAAAVEELRLAIQAGDIYFHAGAFNIEYEQALSADVIDFSFSLARGLADELGVARPTVLSLRDVPGTTRALVPLLVRNNISAISIGVNDAAPNAQMPNPGVWRDAASNTSVLYMQTGPGICYPWPPGADPLHPGGLGVPSCVVVPGLRHAMCWVFRVDNAGPPESVQEVLDAFSISRWQFPGAQVWASTFENFTQHLATIAPALNVTTAEAGDNWMQSTTADPYKIAWYREAARAYAECRAAGGCDPADARIFEFLRMLIKTPEHTFGTPDYYDDSGAWSNPDFHAAVAARQPAYEDALSTYTEQRDMVAREGMRFLADHPLAATIAARTAALTPVRPDVAALVPVPAAQWATPITVATAAGPPVAIGLHPATGALATLVLGGVAWADAAHVLGALTYKTFDDADLATQGAFCCFGHAGRQAAARPNSTASAALLTGVWLVSASAPTAITARMVLPPPLHEAYGAPGEIWATYAVNASAGTVAFTLQVFNKTATRLAEAALLDFAAAPGAGAADAVWLLSKLDSWVDPLDTVAGGSPHSHGVSDGVALASRAAPDAHALFVDSLDAAVFSPATASSPATNFIVPADALVGPVTSLAALLWQNAFNTNTPLFTWTADFQWRFVFHAVVPA